MIYPKNKQYETHFNGNRPFTVIINENCATIYMNNSDSDSNLETKLENVGEYMFSNIWYGKNDRWNKAENWENGNSILLQVASTYIFIGDKMMSFSLKEGDEVIDYYSPVGNCDVPYPYIVGRYYTYFMNDMIIISNNNMNDNLWPYEQMYMLGSEGYAEPLINNCIITECHI